MRRMAGARRLRCDRRDQRRHRRARLGPGFDPNSFVFGIKSGEWNTLLNDEFRPLNYKTVNGTYPPGSTFKMCVALARSRAKVASPGDSVFCGGSTTLGNRRFHCWKRGGHGSVGMRRALSQSC